MDATPGRDLNDEALRCEIELLAEVIALVTGANRPLSQAEVDQALGLLPRPADPGGGPAASSLCLG